MADTQDVNTLKRRGRRRLVGAIALVLVAVIILPWIFDPEPRQTPAVSVRIPNEDESAFKPVPAPTSPVVPPQTTTTAPTVPTAEPQAAVAPESKLRPEPATTSRPAAAATPKAAPGEAERARAEAALANAQYMVPVGAYAKPERVIDKLKAAKIPYFTEPVATAGGTVTRVRAGPFPSRDAAERAHAQIRALGLKPGSVTGRS